MVATNVTLTPDESHKLIRAVDDLNRAEGFLTATLHLLSLAQRGDEIVESVGWTVSEVGRSVGDALKEIQEVRRRLGHPVDNRE